MREFSEVYRVFRPKIVRYLRNLVGDEEAADLAQVVFLKVSRSLGDLRDEEALSSWIYRIATNAARDHASSSAAIKKMLEPSAEGEEAAGELALAESPAAEELYIRREMNDCIRGLVHALPDSYRIVLLLSEFEELANAEIAKILDLPLATVKIRLHRARVALRKVMETECSFYRDAGNELMCDRKG